MKYSKKTAMFGLLTALALVFSYLESLIPLPFGVPGIKLGLANTVVLFALYRLGRRSAGVLSLLRVVLVSVLFGSVMSFAYSLGGAFLSFLTMCLMQRGGRFGITGVSVAGAVAHNAGQLITAAFLLETAGLTWYFPALCLSGTVAGICVGLLAAAVMKRVRAPGDQR